MPFFAIVNIIFLITIMYFNDFALLLAFFGEKE